MLDQQVSDTKNKRDDRSCTRLNTNEEYFYQRWIPVLLVLLCGHVLSFFFLVVGFGSDN